MQLLPFAFLLYEGGWLLVWAAPPPDGVPSPEVAVTGVLVGVATVLVGYWILLNSTFLRGLDPLERSDARPIFWSALGICTALHFTILIGIAYFGAHTRSFYSLTMR